MRHTMIWLKHYWRGHGNEENQVNMIRVPDIVWVITQGWQLKWCPCDWLAIFFLYFTCPRTFCVTRKYMKYFGAQKPLIKLPSGYGNSLSIFLESISSGLSSAPVQFQPAKSSNSKGSSTTVTILVSKNLQRLSKTQIKMACLPGNIDHYGHDHHSQCIHHHPLHHLVGDCQLPVGVGLAYRQVSVSMIRQIIMSIVNLQIYEPPMDRCVKRLLVRNWY